LGNAVTHGSADRPILIDAGAREGHFELSVSNFGEPIAADVIDQLFQPFQRRNAGHRQEGLGLGLYISFEIARAHPGTIDVISDGTVTRFTFRMPLEPKRA
jgi:signal transduction histidine kinase